MSAGHVITVVK